KPRGRPAELPAVSSCNSLSPLRAHHTIVPIGNHRRATPPLDDDQVIPIRLNAADAIVERRFPLNASERRQSAIRTHCNWIGGVGWMVLRLSRSRSDHSD